MPLRALRTGLWTSEGQPPGLWNPRSPRPQHRAGKGTAPAGERRGRQRGLRGEGAVRWSLDPKGATEAQL